MTRAALKRLAALRAAMADTGTSREVVAVRYPDCHRAREWGSEYQCSSNCQWGQMCPHGFVPQTTSFIPKED